jgi:predicted nucleic acid-binding protein
VKLFLDTSSLIKLYYKEEDTSLLDRAFDTYSIQEMFLSDISLVEFHSAIYKKVRMKDLTLQNADDILTSFLSDQNKFKFIPINNEIIKIAQTLIEKYGAKGLRALDAIQFASIWNNRALIDLVISNDKLLNSLLITEGIKIL